MSTKLSYYTGMARRLHPLRAAPKLWNYLKYRLLRRRALVSASRYTPQIIMLVVTKRCNLNCNYCNTAQLLRECGGRWQDSEATLEKVKRIFSLPLLKNSLMVDLFGGEPLLVTELDSIIHYLTDLGCLTNVATNGLLLKDRVSELKRAGLSRINVSFYEKNRKVLERDLPSINAVFPVNGSVVLLRSEVENSPEKLLETARFAREAGCRSLRFWMYRPMGMEPRKEEIILDNNPAYHDFRRRLDSELPGFCLWPAAVKASGVKKLCPQLWQRVGCDIRGDMQMCCSDFDFRGTGANLFTGGADEVFNHPSFVAMRKQLLDPLGEPPEMCKTCNLLGDPGW